MVQLFGGLAGTLTAFAHHLMAGTTCTPRVSAEYAGPQLDAPYKQLGKHPGRAQQTPVASSIHVCDT